MSSQLHSIYAQIQHMCHVFRRESVVVPVKRRSTFCSRNVFKYQIWCSVNIMKFTVRYAAAPHQSTFKKTDARAFSDRWSRSVCLSWNDFQLFFHHIASLSREVFCFKRRYVAPVLLLYRIFSGRPPQAGPSQELVHLINNLILFGWITLSANNVLAIVYWHCGPLW